MARLYGAKLFLLHVEEGVTSRIYGREASTAEVGSRRAVSGAHRPIAARPGNYRRNRHFPLAFAH